MLDPSMRKTKNLDQENLILKFGEPIGPNAFDKYRKMSKTQT